MTKKIISGRHQCSHKESYTQSAIDKMIAAKPASGFKPETDAEWQKAQEALLAMGYAMLRAGGMAHQQAEQLAELIYGGSAGRLLMEIGFEGLRDD